MKPNLQESDIQPNGGSVSRRRNTCLPLGMNRAFTLIELLVVISIIAVLAALLLPTLNVAKNRANTAVDLNNVHQILLAAHLFAGDNDDHLPQPGWGQPGYGTLAPATWCMEGSAGFPNITPPCTAATYPAAYAAQVLYFKRTYPGSAPTQAQACQLYPYLSNPRVLRCPADIPGPDMYNRYVLLSSYVWNGAVVGYAPIWTGVPLPDTFKLSRFKADAILIWEDDEKGTGAGMWNDGSNYPDEGVSARHGQGATVGLFSGGALRMNLTDFYWLAAHQRTKWTGKGGQGWKQFPGGVGLPNQLWCNPGHRYGAADD